jgi:hypothetical protein
MNNQKMTVIGLADPIDVVVKLSKVGVDAARILSVGPAKEEKKDGDKYADNKEGSCKQDMSYPAPPPSWYVRYTEVTETTTRLLPGCTPCSEDEQDKQLMSKIPSTHLTSMFAQHKVQHSSLYSNLKAWHAITKQWQKRGLQHTCVQQVSLLHFFFQPVCLFLA